MILDTSAVVAFLANEPSADAIGKAIASDPNLFLSAVSLAECAIILGRNEAYAAEDTARRIAKLRIRVVPVDDNVALRAAEARLAFSISFGDTFVYALAKERNEPILTLDADFAKTDAALVPLG